MATPEEPVRSVRLWPSSWTSPLPIEDLFAPETPLHVDVGFGKGRFLLARASAMPAVSFLGIDRMLRRLRKVDRRVVRAGLTNVRLLRMEAAYAVRYLLPADAVDVFYILFPDPWPKAKHRRHRYFTPAFLDDLARALKPGGLVHFATDHLPFFEDSREALEADTRFEPAEPLIPSDDERSDFERRFMHHKPIGRCSARLRAEGP